MGLLDRVKAKPAQPLTKIEAEFILAKLRTATYKGNEFEMFYNIFKKVGQHIKTFK